MDPATRDQLWRDLSTGSQKQRAIAIEGIAKFAVEHDAAPHDELVELLSRRLQSDEAETDRDVRELLFEARRRIATRRARLRGVRVRKPDDIDRLLAEDLVWHAISMMWNVVGIHDGLAVLDAGLALANAGQRALYTSWWTQSEVRNGGFHQYFSNATGTVAPYAVDGMRHLGASAIADVVQRAIELLNVPAIHDQRARHVALRQLDRHAFDTLDQEFYALYPDLFQRAASYVRAHPEQFFE